MSIPSTTDDGGDDLYPSDIGDTLPSDPTDGFAERDFRLKKYNSIGVKLKPPTRSTPNLRPEPPVEDTRTTFQGILVKREKEGQWTVIRQDGFRGTATLHGDDGYYYEPRIGDKVTLIAGQVPNTWHIVSRPLPKELERISYKSTEKVQTSNAPKTIKFDETIEQTADDAETFDNDTTGVTGEEVVIKKDLIAEYEISLTVTVEASKVNKKKIKVITDIREGTDAIEALVGEMEIAEWLTEPDWVPKITISTCGY